MTHFKTALIRNLIITSIVVSFIILSLYFFKFDSHITGFFRIGSVLPLSPYLSPEKAYIFQDELGYDGQQFLSLAFDPFLQNDETLKTLDHPSYRYRRIFYPLLSYLLGLGNPRFIPYVMIAINGLAIILLVGIISCYFYETKIPIFQALYVLLIPGVWMVLSLTTADLLSCLAIVTALYCFRSQRPFLTALALAIGSLIRETILLVWVAILVVSYQQKRYQQIKQLGWAILPALVWNLYVIQLNLPGYTGVKANFGLPFLGIVQKSLNLFSEINGVKLFEAYLWILILSIFVAIFWISWQFKRENQLIRWVTIFSGVMFACSSLAILGYYLDYSRVYMEVYFFLILAINYSPIPLRAILMGAAAIGSIAFLALQS